MQSVWGSIPVNELLGFFSINDHTSDTGKHIF